jgi:hypothetical protein
MPLLYRYLFWVAVHLAIQMIFEMIFEDTNGSRMIF